MKTTLTKITGLIAAFLMLACIAPTFAQDGKDYITIKGVVKDITNKRALEYVSISVPGSNISATILSMAIAFSKSVFFNFKKITANFW